MTAGQRCLVTVPPELAYGPKGFPPMCAAALHSPRSAPLLTASLGTAPLRRRRRRVGHSIPGSATLLVDLRLVSFEQGRLEGEKGEEGEEGAAQGEESPSAGGGADEEGEVGAEGGGAGGGEGEDTRGDGERTGGLEAAEEP